VLAVTLVLFLKHVTRYCAGDVVLTAQCINPREWWMVDAGKRCEYNLRGGEAGMARIDGEGRGEVFEVYRRTNYSLLVTAEWGKDECWSFLFFERGKKDGVTCNIKWNYDKRAGTSP